MLKLSPVARSVAVATLCILSPLALAQTTTESKAFINEKGEPVAAHKPIVKELPDGSKQILTKIHGGFGIPVLINVPKMSLRIQNGNIAYYDENGSPVTVAEAERRRIWNEEFDRRLKEEWDNNPELVKEYKARLKAFKESLKNKDAIKYNRTENFIHPGTTPEESRFMNSPETFIRVQPDGKLIYVDKDGRTWKELQELKKAKEKQTAANDTKEDKANTGAVSNKEPVFRYTKRPRNAVDRPAVEPKPEVLPQQQPKKVVPRQTKPTVPLKNREEVDLHEIFSDLPKQQEQAPGKPVSLLMRALDRLASAFVRDAHAVVKMSDMQGKIDSSYLDIPEEQVNRINQYMEESRKVHEEAEALMKRALIDLPKKNETASDANENLTREDKLKKAERIRLLDKATPFESEVLENVVESASEIVRETGNLDLSKFAKPVADVIASLYRDDMTLAAILRRIVRDNPELYDVIPNLDEEIAEMEPKKEGDVDPRDQPVTYIFISKSLSTETLVQMFERNKGRTDVVYVLRGVPEGMDISKGVLWATDLASKVDPVPSLVIDPTLWQEYGITRVPSVVVVEHPLKEVVSEEGQLDRRMGRLLGKVIGLDNDKWLKEQIELGRGGNLGVQGENYEPSERDLIEVMKERAASVDWKAKAEAARDNFWKNRKFDILPTATFPRMRSVDPTILVDRDITDMSGRIIRKAGDRVNPFNQRPFTKTIVIFNAASSDEIERVRLFLEEHKKNGKAMPMLVATAIDKERGWKAYEEITELFDSHLYMLVPEMVERFRLVVTPSVVWGDNEKKVFKVRELGPVLHQRNNK